MAEVKAPATEGASDAGSPRKGKKNLMFGGILLSVMLLEGVGVFFLVKAASPGPNMAAGGQAGGLDPGAGERALDDVELQVASFRAQNEKSRQLVMYDLVVWVAVPKDRADFVKKLFESKQATIKDRLSSVVRAADPQVLAEPDAATLRERFRQELTEIVGEEQTILRVLIPTLVPWRS